MNKWMPIETAPADGDYILVKWKPESRADYLPLVDVSTPKYVQKNMHLATHWMPVPTGDTELIQVGWRTFNGEGGYDFRDYFLNENYKEEWEERNPFHKGWVDALYIVVGKEK